MANRQAQTTDSANRGGVGTKPLSPNQGRVRVAAKFQGSSSDNFSGRRVPSKTEGTK